MSSKGTFPDNDLIIFFLGPLFLILIKLSGKYDYKYQTLSHKKEEDKNMGRKLILMALGTLFYIAVVILLTIYLPK